MNQRRRRRVKILLKLSDFFTSLASFSEISPRDAACAVGRLARSRDFGLLSFLLPFSLRCGDANVREVWREEAAAFSGYPLLREEEKELLCGFADCFGVTTLSAFTEACRKYAGLFAAAGEKEKRDYEKSGALTVGAGVLSAALIAIVLL